jgi:NADH-quinone oxidoreductase subunit N
MTAAPPPAVADFALLAPELTLAGSALTLLMIGVFRGDRATRTIAGLAILALIAAFVQLANVPAEPTRAMTGMFISDGFATFMKALILIGSGFAIVLSLGYIRSERMDRFEFPILILFATTGMMLMVSANDLMALYVGLELQSLSLYVIAAFKRDSARATEAGLKYFVLGALSSGMLLYGCSLIYGFAGTTNFTALARLFDGAGAAVSIGLIIGLVFLAAGLAFKVSAVPFHMWTPDVYEGAPTPVTAFFSVAPKIAAMALFMRTMLGPFGALADDWRQIIVFLAIASMLLGAFAAINQTNIKRLMAYSSIGHVGYALIGLAAGTADGARGVLIYLAVYLAMNVGTFAAILSMRRAHGYTEEIGDLAGLARTQPGLALALGVFMFSLAGIPPLAGFFGKFYVFLAAINAGMHVLAVIGVLASVVGAFYYLRIVKLMYFDEPGEPLQQPLRRELAVILAGTGLFTFLFFIHPTPLLAAAEAAARVLFP